MKLYEIFTRPVIDDKWAAKVLGISLPISQANLTQAYRKLAMKYHPDRGGSEEIFKDIDKAYRMILPVAKAFDKIHANKRVEPKPYRDPEPTMTPDDEFKSMWWQRKATAPFQPMNWQKRP